MNKNTAKERKKIASPSTDGMLKSKQSLHANQDSEQYKKTGYLLDDFRLFHLNEPPAGKTDYHYHDFYKLFFLKSGTGNYNIEGQHHPLSDGDFVFVGKQQIHRPDFPSDQPYERIIIYISPDFLEQHSLADCNFQDLFEGTYGHLLHLLDSQKSYVFDLLQQLESELAHARIGHSVMSNAILMQILVTLLRIIQDQTAPSQPYRNPFSARTKEILAYLSENLSEEITIDQLAAHFFVSKYHLMRSFKEETGQSIHSYLTDQRLLLAKRLIRQGINATQSCYQAGFKNYSSFTRAYKKRFGTTPTGRMETAAKLEETYE